MGTIVLYRLAEALGLITDVKRDRAGTVLEYTQPYAAQVIFDRVILAMLVLTPVILGTIQFLIVRRCTRRWPRWVLPGLCGPVLAYALLVFLRCAPCVHVYAPGGFHLKELCAFGYAVWGGLPLIGVCIGGLLGRRRRASLT